MPNTSTVTFAGTAVAAAAELFFQGAATSGVFPRAASKVKINNTDAGEVLQLSLDGGSTWHNVAAGKSETFEGRIRNSRNSFLIRKLGAGNNATFTGHCELLDSRM